MEEGRGVSLRGGGEGDIGEMEGGYASGSGCGMEWRRVEWNGIEKKRREERKKERKNTKKRVGDVISPGDKCC